MRIRRRIALASATVLLSVVAMAIGATGHGPAGVGPGRAHAALPQPTLAITGGTEHVVAGGRLETAATVMLPSATRRLSVRFRMVDLSGRVVFDQTVSRGKTAAGTVTLALSRALDRHRVPQGRYRLEARATASGYRSLSTTAAVYVIDPATEPLPVCVVVRLDGAPLADPSGSLATDPAAEPSARAQAAAFAQLRSARPDLRLALAVPPVLLAQWRDVAGGYRLADSSAAAVTADGATPVAHRETLAALSRVLEDGRGLVAVPYAQPALDELATYGALQDLQAQLAFGARETSRAIGVTPGAVAMVDGDHLDARALPILRDSGIDAIVVDAAYTRARRGGRDTTATPGTYAIDAGGIDAIVPDGEIGTLIGGPIDRRAQLVDALFSRLTASPARRRPVVAVVAVGPGSGRTFADVEPTLTALGRLGWVRFVDIDAATAARAPSAVTLRSGTSTTPTTLWKAIATARERVRAYAAAAGAQDPGVEAATRDLFISQSAPLERQDPDRAAAFAASALARSDAVLAKTRLAIPNVMFSGSTGKVPVSVVNDSGRPLTLTLRSVPTRVRLRSEPSMTFLAQPGENIVSIAVDMGSAVSGAIDLELTAGDVRLSTGRSTVRSSYVDRLVVVGGVILVLASLLLYIRRKGAAALFRAGPPRESRSRTDR